MLCHGANDVANAIGPFAAMWVIYNGIDISKKNDMETDAYWILGGVGGIGIAVGLYGYGKRITHAIGTKLCSITPSRGVSIELASALVIITGSRLKIPLSTTHCQVGATVGVGSRKSKTCGGIIVNLGKNSIRLDNYLFNCRYNSRIINSTGCICSCTYNYCS